MPDPLLGDAMGARETSPSCMARPAPMTPSISFGAVTILQLHTQGAGLGISRARAAARDRPHRPRLVWFLYPIVDPNPKQA